MRKRRDGLKERKLREREGKEVKRKGGIKSSKEVWKGESDEKNPRRKKK